VTRRLVVRPEAVADLAAAFAWYERERPGLGTELHAAIGSTFRLLTRAPEAMPAVHRGARRALLRRFPYAVYYTVEKEAIEVLAVLHTRRNPRRWQRRVREP
jgi:plasmid stabilization system protein ParE